MNLRTSRLEDLALEKQAKFVEDRFQFTEDEMAKWCSSFSQFTRRTAKYRDSNDQLALMLYDYSAKEQINRTLKTCLTNVAHSLALLGDHRNNSTQYLEEQVMTSLKQYATSCRNAKLEIKRIHTAKEKELCKRRQLTKIRQRLPQNNKLVAKAETDLIEACAKVSQMQGALEEFALSFERSKLNDMKRILHDFIKAELLFHMRALENLSVAYKEIDEINVDLDYSSFKTVLKQTDVALRLDIVKKNIPLGHSGIPEEQSLTPTFREKSDSSQQMISDESVAKSTEVLSQSESIAEESGSSYSSDDDEGHYEKDNFADDNTIHVKPSSSIPDRPLVF